MFGTLIVQLPSQYEGGQLRVNHAGKEHTFDFSGVKGSIRFHYAALYADCQHELCSVTKGYRLCLVYNLIHVGSGHCPAPIDNTVLVRRTVSALKGWAAQPSKYKPMVVIPLEHKYCAASLSFSNLKNLDRAKAELVKVATREVDFDLYLCIVSVSQYWSAICYGEIEEGQLDEQEAKADHLVSPDDKKAESLDLDKLIEEGTLNDLLHKEPDTEEVEEASGNEGATIERWYNQAALLLWPKQQRIKVLGLDTVASRLAKSIEKRSPLERDSTKWQKYHDVCLKLISATLSEMPDAQTAATVLSCAIALGEFSLVSTLLGSASSGSTKPSVPASLYLKSAHFVDSLLVACLTFGWCILQPCLQGLLEVGATHDVESCVQFLYRLATSQPFLNRKLQKVGQELALPVCKVLVKEQDIAAIRPSTQWHWQSCQPSHRSRDFVCNLLKILSLLEYNTQLEQVLQRFSSLPNRYPLETVLLPAAEEFHQWMGEKSSVLLGFAAHCIKALEASTKAPIKEPPNWTQDVTISCKCSNCTELQSFFRHPTRTSVRFKAKETQRSHLEQQMRANKKCECSHKTEYSGIPRTLVVTKTRERFERKMQERKTNLLMLSRLRALHEANSTEPSEKRACLVDLTNEH